MMRLWWHSWRSDSCGSQSGGKKADSPGDVLKAVESRGRKLTIQFETCQDGGLMCGGFSGYGALINAADESSHALHQRGVSVPAEMEGFSRYRGREPHAGDAAGHEIVIKAVFVRNAGSAA